MRTASCVTYLTAAVAVSIGAFTFSTTASAQTIVEAVYRVSLEDPATGNVYYVDRNSIRSWSSEKQCENQIGSFSGFHTSAVRDFGIKNAEGNRLIVDMADMYCVVTRE